MRSNNNIATLPQFPVAIVTLFVVVSSRFNGTEGIYGCCEKRQGSRFGRTTLFGGSYRFRWRAVTVILSKLSQSSNIAQSHCTFVINFERMSKRALAVRSGIISTYHGPATE
jgi:hypothetical protein